MVCGTTDKIYLKDNGVTYCEIHYMEWESRHVALEQYLWLEALRNMDKEKPFSIKFKGQA